MKRKVARDRFRKFLEKELEVYNIYLHKYYYINNTLSIWILFKVDPEKRYEHINKSIVYYNSLVKTFYHSLNVRK